MMEVEEEVMEVEEEVMEVEGGGDDGVEEEVRRWRMERWRRRK